MDFKGLFGAYYALTKPGIVYGNVLTATAGFLLASKFHIDIWIFVSLLVGMSLVIAASCVCNNYLDRDIDKKMLRTKNRALANGAIRARSALVFAAVLFVVGVAILSWGTNALVVWIGVVGVLDYIVLYGYAKRHSSLGTLVGSISGAMPIVAGYVAASGHIDAATIILFAMLTFWQMPHFYAIALHRSKDYRAARLPVLPIVRGSNRTKLSILVYIVLFIGSSSLLTIFDYTGWLYLVAVSAVGVAWLVRGVRNFYVQSDEAWGRGMFFFSLKVIMVLSVSVSLGAILP